MSRQLNLRPLNDQPANSAQARGFAFVEFLLKTGRQKHKLNLKVGTTFIHTSNWFSLFFKGSKNIPHTLDGLFFRAKLLGCKLFKLALAVRVVGRDILNYLKGNQCSQTLGGLQPRPGRRISLRPRELSFCGLFGVY